MKLSPRCRDAAYKIIRLCKENQKSFAAMVGLSEAVISSCINLDSQRGISEKSWAIILEGLHDLIRRRQADLVTWGREAEVEQWLAALAEEGEAVSAAVLVPPGGPLPVEAANYFERTADRRLKDAVNDRIPLLTLSGSIRSGRTSMLRRAEGLGCAAGMRVVTVDLANLVRPVGVQGHQILTHVAQALDLPHPLPTTEMEFIAALADTLNVQDRHTLLLLDDMDVLPMLGEEVAAPLLLALTRFRSDLTRTGSPLKKLSIVAVFTGDMWGQGHASSVPGLGLQIALTGFSREQVGELAKIVLGQDGPFAWLDELHALFRGHPYLTHLFLEELRYGADAEEVFEDARAIAGPFSAYLNWLTQRFEVVVPDRVRRNFLLETLRGRNGEEVVVLDPTSTNIMMHLGLLDPRSRVTPFAKSVLGRLSGEDG